MTQHADYERPTTTLLFAVALPNDFDPEEVDPEQVADELVAIINEERRRSWPEQWPASRVFVSGIPAAQWLKRSTMRDLSAAIERERATRIDHLRLFHPDRYEEPIFWPDGEPMIVDCTLEPEDFDPEQSDGPDGS